MTVPDPITRPPDHRIPRSPDGSMFWRLWWRALSVKRSQAALALGSLVVGATITSMLLNLYGDVRRKMTEDFRAYGANVVIAPRSSAIDRSGQENSVVDEAALQPLGHFVHQTPGTSFAPVLYGVVRVSPDPADPRLPEFTNVVATGANFGALRGLNPGWSATGQAVPEDLPPGTCALGANLAARLHVHPGDSLQLHPLGGTDAGAISRFASFRIASVVTTGASEDDQVFLPLGALQSFLGLHGKVTLVEISIPGGTRDVESAVQRLAGLLPGLEVRPIRQIVYSEGKVLGTIRWLLLSLTILILVIIALCVMATMTAIVLERRRDIGSDESPRGSRRFVDASLHDGRRESGFGGRHFRVRTRCNCSARIGRAAIRRRTQSECLDVTGSLWIDGSSRSVRRPGARARLASDSAHGSLEG